MYHDNACGVNMYDETVECVFNINAIVSYLYMGKN